MKSLYTGAVQRLSGKKPSPFRAVAAAVAAGTATGVLTYRLLRS